MGYKNPHDPRRLVKDFNYMNTERGYVTRMISTKFKPSYVKYGGHIPAPSIDICAYCEQPFTFITRMGTRGKGYQGRKGQHKTNVSIDRWDPRLTYQANNIIFSCVDCNDKKRNSNPNDWVNYIRVGKEKIDD